MFWKRRQAAPAPTEVTHPATKTAVQPQAKADKLPGPKEIPELVGRHLVVEKNKDPDWVWHLRAVVRKSPRAKKAFDVRVFDDNKVVQKKVKVKDWTTFDQHPDLILYEGWFDKDSMRVELEEKKTA